MTPVDFKERNLILKCPPGVENCDGLPVFRRVEGVRTKITSVWEFTEAEVNAIIKARSEGKLVAVVFTAFTADHPVISMGVTSYAP